jgi:undecaprenyl diphosphate synthase
MAAAADPAQAAPRPGGRAALAAAPHPGALHAGTLNPGPQHTGPQHTGTLNTGALNPGTLNAGTLNAGALNAGAVNGGAAHAGASLAASPAGAAAPVTALTGAPVGPAALAAAPLPTAQPGAAARGACAVPNHVAIIMDGNGRWAAARGLPRVAGHRAGAQAVRRTIEAAVSHGVAWLTLFAFSSENWRRPAAEVTDLTGLLRHYLRTEVAELHAEGVRLRIIGDRARFDGDIRAELARAERLTEQNARLNLTVALSYGGRAEIVAAARALAEAARDGTLDPAALDEAAFAARLATAAIPDPDLVVRTSGEQRLSNFLLWQSAYAEFAFPDVLWPDFGAAHFAEALADYARRERRFGARPG